MCNTLTAQQIVFIDHYLENSGIDYTDIRIEMTDHVAAALEAMEGDDFDENFRLYMLEHKQELLKNNSHFKRMATRRAFRVLGSTLIKPLFLILPFVIVYLSFYFSQFTGVDEMSDNLQLVYLSTLFLPIVPLVMSHLNGKKKFSVASKVVNVPGLILYLAHSVSRPWRFYDNAWASFVFFAVLITISVAVAFTAYTQTGKYSLRYNG